MKAKDRRPPGIFINFSPHVSRIRKELKAEVQRQRAQGETANISFDRIQVWWMQGSNLTGSRQSGGRADGMVASTSPVVDHNHHHSYSEVANPQSPQSASLIVSGRADVQHDDNPQVQNVPPDLADQRYFTPLRPSSDSDTTYVKLP